MKKEKNKESASATPKKSAEPMFLNTIDEALLTTATENRYVVVRDGHRVSDIEYLSATNEKALEECAFWTRIATNHSYGETVEIVAYDPRKHKVW